MNKIVLQSVFALIVFGAFVSGVSDVERIIMDYN